MQKSLLFTLCCLLFSCGTNKKIEDHFFQRRYFPPELTSLYFNMPFEQVEKIRPAMMPEDTNHNAWTTYREMINREQIKEVVYYFNKTDQPILYGFSIQYETSEARLKEMRWRYGKPNHEETEWKKESKEGFQLHLWAEQASLFIFGEISGTQKPKSPKD